MEIYIEEDRDQKMGNHGYLNTETLMPIIIIKKKQIHGKYKSYDLNINLEIFYYIN